MPARFHGITCVQTPNTRTQSYDRYIFTIDLQNRLIDVVDENWNTAKNTQSGSGEIGNSMKDKPVSAKTVGSNLTYSYNIQDEGDGDFPGPKLKVTVTLPESFKGAGLVHIDYKYKDGKTNDDDVKITCQ